MSGTVLLFLLIGVVLLLSGALLGALIPMGRQAREIRRLRGENRALHRALDDAARQLRTRITVKPSVDALGVFQKKG